MTATVHLCCVADPEYSGCWGCSCGQDNAASHTELALCLRMGGQVNRQQTHRQVKKKIHKHMPEGGRQEVEAGYAVRCGGSSVCPGESFLIK